MPEFKDWTYEERLKWGLPTLKERWDLIIINKLVNDQEELDRIYLLLRKEKEAGYLTGHSKTLRKGKFSNIFFSFLHRSIETWNWAGRWGSGSWVSKALKLSFIIVWS